MVTNSLSLVIDVFLRLGFSDVMHYLVSCGHVDVTRSDLHGRSLLFSAVMHNQPEVVRYLVTRVGCLCRLGFLRVQVIVSVPGALVAVACLLPVAGVL